ncbi:hypothetical protein V2J09_001303 [Rumex salicifolius]
MSQMSEYKAMSDFLRFSTTRANMESSMSNSEGKSRLSLVAAIPKPSPEKEHKKNSSKDQSILSMETAMEVGWFLLKMATLEAIRKFSKAHCPLAWHGLQALQVVCYSPFKWIEKWAPTKFLVNFMQTLSRPLLLLSVATSLPDWSEPAEDSSSSSDTFQACGDSESNSNCELTTSGSRSAAEAQQNLIFGKWMSRLLSELNKEGINLPERISEDDIYRFYTSTNGDFPTFLSAIKKTIQWRQTFKFLSLQELDGWSSVVFWHERDKKGRPCLFVRLGLACSDTTHKDRSRLNEIEHGVLNLIDSEARQIIVVMDCEGLTPFRFPMQTMRSCAILLQDHYPNRLAALFVIRLPPIARVIAQTLFQVLRPGTRKKLRIGGDNYRKVLLELFETLPSFLGGDCSCPRCRNGTNVVDLTQEQTTVSEPITPLSEIQSLSYPLTGYQKEDLAYVGCKRAMKLAIISSLILFCIAFFLATHNSFIIVDS